MPTPAHQPPEILRLLAHPLRWQIARALVISDQRVQELVEQLHQPYNLVSYHLKLLRQAGLATLRQSDADGRDLYYHLDLAKLQEAYQAAGLSLFPGWEWRATPLPVANPQEPTRVLFLCTYNSARSQMAEGWLRHLGGTGYTVTSAGSQPRPIHPAAISAMRERGIDLQGQRSRHLDELHGLAFDIAITVCDRVREQCQAYAFCETNLHWSIPDPARLTETQAQRQAFEATAVELEQRIRQFLAWNAVQQTTV